MEDKTIGAQIKRLFLYAHVAILPHCIQPFFGAPFCIFVAQFGKIRGQCLSSVRQAIGKRDEEISLSLERTFMQLFLVDQHEVKTYQASAVVPWPTSPVTTSEFLRLSSQCFDHPELKKEPRGLMSLKCAVHEGGSVVWAHVANHNWVLMTPQDNLAIFLSYEEPLDWSEPGDDAKDEATIRDKTPKFCCLTGNAPLDTGADGFLTTLPETHQELRNIAWVVFGGPEKTKAKTVLMTSLLDPTGHGIWTIFNESVYEHLVSTCSSDVLHVKVSFS